MPSAVPRARGANPEAPAPSNCAVGTQAPSNFAGHARARANPVAARRRSISRDSSRATRPPASLRRLHPETSRHRIREPRDQCCAFCSSHYHSSSPCRRRSTHRRSTPFSSRFNFRFSLRCDLRPSPALFAPPPREINTIAQPQHTPLRTHTTGQAHTSQWTRRGTLERGQDDLPFDLLRHLPLHSPGIQPTIHRVCPPARPPRTSGAAFGRPCRCAREAGAHAAGARARGRARAMSAPAPARLRRLHACREARRHLHWPSARASERAASPVLLTACALLPRCRQPQLREVGLDGHRALDISATTGRRDVDTTVTRIQPSSRPQALPLGPRAARSLCMCL